MVAVFVLLQGSMLWGLVESGLTVVFSKSRRWFSLIMKILASELCSIATEVMRSPIYLHRDQIGLNATIQKDFQQIGLQCDG